MTKKRKTAREGFVPWKNQREQSFNSIFKLDFFHKLNLRNCEITCKTKTKFHALLIVVSSKIQNIEFAY